MLFGNSPLESLQQQAHDKGSVVSESLVGSPVMSSRPANCRIHLVMVSSGIGPLLAHRWRSFLRPRLPTDSSPEVEHAALRAAGGCGLATLIKERAISSLSSAQFSQRQLEWRRAAGQVSSLAGQLLQSSLPKWGGVSHRPSVRAGEAASGRPERGSLTPTSSLLKTPTQMMVLCDVVIVWTFTMKNANLILESLDATVADAFFLF